MAMQNQTQSKAERDYIELDLGRIRELITKCRLPYTFTILLLTATAVISSYLVTPNYKSVIVLTPAGSQTQAEGLGGMATQLGPLTSLLGSGFFSSEDEQVTLAILGSRKFGDKFIEDHNLLADISGLKAGDLALLTTSELEYTKWKAFEKFDKELRMIDQDVRSGLIRVSLDWEDPHVGAELNNAMIRELNQHLRQVAIRESNSSLEYLSAKLEDTTNAELQSTLYRLIEKELKVSMLANVREDYALKIIDPAVPPQKKSSPDRMIYLILGLFSGIICTVLHIAYKYRSRKSVEGI